MYVFKEVFRSFSLSPLDLLHLCILQAGKTSPPKKLEDEEWFHGVLPREEVQRLLSDDGDFLVRESKNKRTNETQFVLSAYWQGYRHFIIQFQEVIPVVS